MTDYLEHLAEDRRLAILRVLAEAQGYAANDSVLHTALWRLGHVVSRDQIKTDIAWLAEQGLVGREMVEGSVHVVTLTQRGQDVAEGIVTQPGIKRPSPRG